MFSCRRGGVYPAVYRDVGWGPSAGRDAVG